MKDLNPTQMRDIGGGVNEDLVDLIREFMRQRERDLPGVPDPMVF